jgi:hypothetical protein
MEANGRFSISKGKSGINGSKIDQYKVIEIWEGGNRSNSDGSSGSISVSASFHVMINDPAV